MKTQSTTPQPRALPRTTLTAALLLPAILLLLTIHSGQAGSATWNISPTSSDWNTAANWTPGTIPNGPNDTATFAVSNTTGVIFSATTKLNGIVFNASASAYTIDANSGALSPLTIGGIGVENDSAMTQNFLSETGAGYSSRTARRLGVGLSLPASERTTTGAQALSSSRTPPVLGMLLSFVSLVDTTNQRSVRFISTTVRQPETVRLFATELRLLAQVRVTSNLTAPRRPAQAPLPAMAARLHRPLGARSL